MHIHTCVWAHAYSPFTAVKTQAQWGLLHAAFCTPLCLTQILAPGKASCAEPFTAQQIRLLSLSDKLHKNSNHEGYPKAQYAQPFFSLGSSTISVHGWCPEPCIAFSFSFVCLPYHCSVSHIWLHSIWASLSFLSRNAGFEGKSQAVFQKVGRIISHHSANRRKPIQ